MKMEKANALHYPPVPGWFAGYVSEVLPRGLVLKKLEVRRESDKWLVHIAGYGQDTLPKSAKQLAAFEQELQDGRFHVVVTKSWRESWLTNLRRGIRPNANEESQTFELMGQIG